MVFTKEVTNKESAPNIIPAKNPTSGVRIAKYEGTRPKTVKTLITAKVKKNPLVPTKSISPTNKSVTVMEAETIPS